jgi:membrane dipeptidase
MAKAHGKPVIATHANAFTVHPHTRNLTDGEFRAIADCGGIVGISLCPEHLTAGSCGIGSVADHIRHYIRLGGEDAVCLGCDFDGIGETPEGLFDVSCLIRLADHLSTAGIPSRMIDKLLFDNAYGFATGNFQ